MSTLPLNRRFYAEELRAVAGIRSDALVEAFATVPREAFLGPGPWQVLSIPHGAPRPTFKATRRPRSSGETRGT